MVHLVWLFMKTHLLALLQDNWLGSSAFLRKLSACVRNTTACCQHLLRPIKSAVLADTDTSAKPKYRSIFILHTWPNQRSWNLFIGRSDSTFRVAFTWDSTISVMNPWFMTIREDWNKDRFKNWQPCGVLKLPFCGISFLWTQSNTPHTELRLLCQTVHQSPCLVSVTREYHPNVLELIHLLRCIAAYLQRTRTLVF